MLVEIKDTSILEHNGGKKFLLQVWDIDGNMVYERSLSIPCCSWGINIEPATAENPNPMHTFIYQEIPDQPEVIIVRLVYKQKPKVHKFTFETNKIPLTAAAMKFDSELNRFVKPFLGDNAFSNVMQGITSGIS